ncbi:MAG: putative ATP-dependent helicase [Prokaryotic dsDNA virus sp.]|jgi:twinkle protein|nr:hypothetical protein [Flavobacteriaceae bacterium]QDP68345.1 MAG: putative ATP-dependent helicase [Prokaryotic dsDNA virus sp.]|tara:strand:- start:31093 stop:32739 length:1647 start_codon:yes stop_codon:yes gene_type:complete
MGMKNEEAEYLHKTNCEKCGSSDANAVYSNGNTHCFSCSHTSFNNTGSFSTDRVLKSTGYEPSHILIPDSIRGINKSTLEKFKYGVVDKKHCTYYFDTEGNIVAEKYRKRGKEFAWKGNAREATLFGQQLWKPNKKLSITITEGEIDAMSISQLQNNKFPVVSVPNGAAAAKKDIKKNMEFLLGFKEIRLCFDNDDVGKQAAREVSALFPPKFVKIVTLPLKDANDMLKEGRASELSQALMSAKPYTPDGILSGTSILERLSNETQAESFPFPDFMEITNEKTKGIRLSELDVYTSGTGSGKTTLLKQLQYHYYKTTNFNQALIHLEEPLEHTAKDLVGISMETRLQLRDDIDKESYMTKAKEIFEAVDDEGNSRFALYDSFGSMESEDLYNKIRFMVKGLDCKIIWLDHLSILVSGMGNDGDERRTIDKIMHELKSLTIELGCYIGLVVHLNNNTMTPFENGGIPTVNNLRGSGGIKQLANSIYAFSRNQQADDETERNTSLFSVLKCRYTGMTGPADYLFYNGFTGKLEKGEKPNTKEKVEEDHGF